MIYGTFEIPATVWYYTAVVRGLGFDPWVGINKTTHFVGYRFNSYCNNKWWWEFSSHRQDMFMTDHKTMQEKNPNNKKQL